MRATRDLVLVLAALCGALAGTPRQSPAAAGEVLYSDCYRCFEALQIAGAGTAAGGRFTGIGELYFLPGIRHGKPGLYAVGPSVSRFLELPRIPRSSKEDYLLTIEIVSNHEYVFVIRHEDETSRHADLGWSITLYSQKREKPKWEKRLVVLLAGRDSTATDAVRAEIRRAIPHLSDRFDELPHDEVYPVVNRFAGEFDRVANALRGCAESPATDEPELAAAAALEHVELLRALERADRFLVRGDEESWVHLLEEDLVEELCRNVSCGDDESATQVQAEARRLVDEISRLHARIASLRETHGTTWERSLLESLLRDARLDPSMAGALLEHREERDR